MLWLALYRNYLLSDRHRLGRWGEFFCIKHLRNKGFKLLARNYNCPAGEIDLVFIAPNSPADSLVFVEVKTRVTDKLYRGRPLVSYRQRRRITAAAKYFRKVYSIKDKPIRFDIVTIVLPRKGKVVVNHQPNAFAP